MKSRFADFASTVRRIVRLRFRRAEEACLTHTPGAWCQPGAVYERGGKRLLVTELRREIDTGLIGGGRASCWSVLVKRIDDLPNAEASGRRDQAAFAGPDGCLNPAQEKS